MFLPYADLVRRVPRPTHTHPEFPILPRVSIHCFMSTDSVLAPVVGLLPVGPFDGNDVLARLATVRATLSLELKPRHLGR